jgi:hypothetical protein
MRCGKGWCCGVPVWRSPTMDPSEMNNQTLSHDDAMALMAGSLPEGRPDLVALAAAIEDFRDAFAEAPQPSPELAGWLTGAPASRERGTESTAPAATEVQTRTGALSGGMRAAARALAGLGVTAKIALGGTAALAAVASAGAVGALPDGPQAVFDRILDNNHADAPLPRTPSDQTAQTDTPRGARAEAGSGEQRHTQQRSPSQTTRETQAGGSGDRSQDTTSNPPRGGSDPAPESEGRDDSDDSRNDRPEGPDKEPAEPDNQFDDEPDEESERERERDDGDERSQGDDAEETDDSSDAAADADDSRDSSDDKEDVDAETEEASSN